MSVLVFEDHVRIEVSPAVQRAFQALEAGAFLNDYIRDMSITDRAALLAAIAAGIELQIGPRGYPKTRTSAQRELWRAILILAEPYGDLYDFPNAPVMTAPAVTNPWSIAYNCDTDAENDESTGPA
jgi:hypothetical protein